MKSPLLLSSLLASQVLALFSPYEDIFSSPKYVLRYDHSEALTPSEAHSLIREPENSTYELLKSHDGSDYLCQIPPPPNSEDQAQIIDESITSQLNQLSVKIVTELKDDVLFHFAGYWTYAFTQKGEVAQFSGNPDQYLKNNVFRFVLGRRNSRIDFPKLEAKKDQNGVFLSQTMENGTICDVTGKPRSVEIQYVCDPSVTRPALMWVKEYRTCHYQAQVAIPFLCEDEMLKQRDLAYGEITCKRVVDQKLRAANEVFNDHTSRIDLSDHDLTHLGESLFLAKPKEGPLRFIDVGDGDLVSRFFRTFAKWFPRKFVEDFAFEQILEQQRFLKYSAHTFDKTGRFLTTVFVEITRNEQGQIVVVADEKPDMVLGDTNLQLIHSLDSQGGPDHIETDDKANEDNVLNFIQTDTRNAYALEVEVPNPDENGKAEKMLMLFEKDDNGNVKFLGFDDVNGDQSVSEADDDTDEYLTVNRDNVVHDEL